MFSGTKFSYAAFLAASYFSSTCFFTSIILSMPFDNLSIPFIMAFPVTFATTRAVFKPFASILILKRINFKNFDAFRPYTESDVNQSKNSSKSITPFPSLSISAIQSSKSFPSIGSCNSSLIISLTSFISIDPLLSAS